VGRALGDVLPLAVAVAIFPVPIIAVVLMLGSARSKAVAFILFWVVGLAGVGAIVLLLAGGADASEGGGPAAWANVLLLCLGLVLFASALKQWRGRPRAPEEPAVPAWMRTIDDLTLAKAAGAGFALSALNPKNVLLVVAAATEIADVGIPARQELGVLLAFVFVASLGVLAPLVVSLVLGERSRESLDAMRAWMARYSAAIMAVLFLVIGAKLVGDAIAGFSA